MPERKRKFRVVLLHLVLLPTLLYVFNFFTLAPQQKYPGVDETVVEKIAKEHGRQAKRPLLDPGEGDLLLFAFLLAGVFSGFGGGYWWRALNEKKAGHPKEKEN